MYNFKLTLLSFLFFIAFFPVVRATEQSEITELLSNVVDSFNNQDCSSYSSYFVTASRAKKRRESGLYFASNNSVMKLKESHILSDGDNKVEVAVSYSLDQSDYVSRLFLEKENDLWKISKEVFVRTESNFPYVNYDPNTSQPVSPRNQVYTSNPFSNRPIPPDTQNCANGKCGGPQAPFSTLKACRDYGFDPIPCRNGSCSIK